jgi:GAF domain-containing protein
VNAPQPTDEMRRIAALRRYAVLDTGPEESFDEIVQLAARSCNTPIALITFIDEARQWFKARVGLDISETVRESSFCAYAIQARELVVPDAWTDERFRNNPLVLHEPHIRFYAGLPLRSTLVRRRCQPLRGCNHPDIVFYHRSRVRRALVASC